MDFDEIDRNPYARRGVAEARNEIFKAIEKNPKIIDIITIHSMIGGAVGLIPIPGLALVVVLGNIYTMYGRINAAVGIKFSENIIKSIVGMVAANLKGYAGLDIGTAVAAEVAKFIPFIGSLGYMASMTPNMTVTEVQGKIYCEWLRLMANQGALKEDGTLDESLAKDTLKDIFNDKEKIQNIINTTKQEAKQQDYKQYINQAKVLINQHKKES